VCVAKLEDGKSCGKPLQCLSSYCVDGVCCDTDCQSQCQACDVAGKVGTCTTVSDSGPPHGGRLRCDGAGPCRGSCDGTKPDVCTFPGDSKLCSDPSCTSDVATSAGACDGVGACKKPDTTECFPYVCGVTSCRTLCAEPTDCVRGYDCIGQHCVPLGGMMTMDAALEASFDDAKTEASEPVDAGTPDADASMTTVDAGHDAEAGVGEAAVDVAPQEAEQGGCGCRVASSTQRHIGGWAALFVAAAFAARRRKNPVTPSIRQR
jgi:MYXO-CTERM domain-containing protein